MLRHSRLTFVSILLLLALIVPTNVVQAQATPQAPADLSVAPDANLAVPDEVAQVVKSRESLTADQLSKIHAVLDSHKAEFQEVNNALTALESPPSAQDKKLFLPLLNAGGDAQSQAAAAQSASAPKARSAEKAGQLRQVTVRLLALQNKVDQEVNALLTASQSEVYAKQAAKLQSTGQAMAAKLQAAATQSPEGAESTTDCFYGAYYNAYANYYSWLEYYYGYYDYYYYGNGANYAYYDYLYAYYAYYYVNVALPYAGGAYFDATYGFGYDRGSLSDTAYSYLSSAYYYGYYAYYYGYYSYYYYGSSYGYYSYYYGYYYAYPYEYYAKYYENLC